MKDPKNPAGAGPQVGESGERENVVCEGACLLLCTASVSLAAALALTVPQPQTKSNKEAF